MSGILMESLYNVTSYTSSAVFSESPRPLIWNRFYYKSSTALNHNPSTMNIFHSTFFQYHVPICHRLPSFWLIYVLIWCYRISTKYCFIFPFFNEKDFWRFSLPHPISQCIKMKYKWILHVKPLHKKIRSRKEGSCWGVTLIEMCDGSSGYCVPCVRARLLPC